MRFLSQEQISIKIGENVRNIRELNGWTRSFLAESSSLHDNTIKNIELGKLIPNVYTLYKISQVLEVNIEKFLEDIE